MDGVFEMVGNPDPPPKEIEPPAPYKLRGLTLVLLEAVVALLFSEKVKLDKSLNKSV